MDSILKRNFRWFFVDRSWICVCLLCSWVSCWLLFDRNGIGRGENWWTRMLSWKPRGFIYQNFLVRFVQLLDFHSWCLVLLEFGFFLMELCSWILYFVLSFLNFQKSSVRPICQVWRKQGIVWIKWSLACFIHKPRFSGTFTLIILFPQAFCIEEVLYADVVAIV